MKSTFNIKGAIITSIVFLLFAISSVIYIKIKTPKLEALEIPPEVTTTIYTTIYSTAIKTKLCKNNNIPLIILYLPEITKMENTIVIEVVCHKKNKTESPIYQYFKFHYLPPS